MFRLSKRQMTERDRVLAWLNNQPFSTSARSKPAVPVLTPAEVREKYCPLSPQETGQFFTPEAMANDVYAGIDGTGLVVEGDILDPCAGLGALIAPLEDHAEVRVTAYELDPDCSKIGKRLLPWVSWNDGNMYDHVSDHPVNGMAW